MSQSLDRGLLLLAEIAAGKTMLGELAEALGVHKSTVLRLLRPLEEHHFVHRDRVHHYRLGRRIFDLANQALEQRDVRAVAAPFLRSYNQQCGHTVQLATYEAGEAVYIDHYESRHMLRMHARIGDVAPLHCTASGKVLLANQDQAEQERVVAGLELVAFTRSTITDRAALLTELKVAREQGYALDRGEREEVVHGAAVPVWDAAGAVACAVSVSVPVPMLGADGIHAYLPDLLTTAAAISAASAGADRGPTRAAPPTAARPS